MTIITRPAFRYHGSKFRLASWIIGYFAEHECYVEPYGGGASVLLQKPRSWLEVYNDKAHQVVRFFQALRERPDDLVRAIQLTPYAKDEWQLAYEHPDDGDLVEQARRFYIRAYMSIAGPTGQWRTGWRRQKVITKDGNRKKMTPAPISFMSVDHLHDVANRFRGVQIECDEALAVIARYDSPSTLFYCDPPYPAETRGRWKATAYTHEMTGQDHSELAAALHGIEGMAIISGYDCPLYSGLYSDWRHVARAARVNGAGMATEILWLSPALVTRWERQLPLFGVKGEQE